MALGAGEDRVDRWLAAGRLHRLHVGVYAVGHRALAPRGRWMAAVLACGPDAALSHASAGALLDVRASSAVLVDVAVAERIGRARPGIRVHRPKVWAPEDRTVVDGIPCTTVARTLVDLAGVLKPPALERAVERAARTQVLDVRAIADVLERVDRPRGVRALRRALAIAASAPFTRSELERRFLALCRDAGLPQPLTNAHVETSPGQWIEVDFLWPTKGLAVETDGWATHGTPLAVRRDRRRDRALRAAGWEVERFDWTEVVLDPAGTVNALRR
jgi:hypothetical protein